MQGGRIILANSVKSNTMYHDYVMQDIIQPFTRVVQCKPYLYMLNYVRDVTRVLIATASLRFLHTRSLRLISVKAAIYQSGETRNSSSIRR